MKKLLDYNIPIENREHLPTYPIPDRVETLERFLEWVQPLLTKKEYNETVDLVTCFIESDTSIKLHEKLCELGDIDDDSWIFEYWFKTYLKSRDVFAPFINVPMVYENMRIDDLTVAEKAAAIIFSVSNVYSKFKKEGNGEYYIGKKRYSSDQFHGTFSSINHIQRDTNKYYINDKLSSNVIIIYRNNIYSLEVIDSSKEVSSADSIYKAIKSIYNQSLRPTIPNINFVTAEPNKDIAGDYLAEILKDTSNMENYQKIKEAIFILNLDEDSPTDITEKLYAACLDDQNFNRFHGKGLEFSISKNGSISFIVDHAFTDGGSAIYLVNQMDLFLKNIEFLDDSQTIHYEELLFDLDRKMSLKLIKSFNDYSALMDSFTASYIDLENLSRSYLKEKGILSGDGFFHLALQVAQKKTFNSVSNTYIAVDMRTFFRGRTESNRPVTQESIEFVQALLDPKGDISDQKRLLEKALDAHYKRTVLCTKGKGVNRYLYILEQLYDDFKEELNIAERPALFESFAYRAIDYNKISTTSFCNKFLKSSYFPPIVKGGLGIFYSVSDKSFAIITAFNEDAAIMKEFNKNLKDSIDEMIEVIS